MNQIFLIAIDLVAITGLVALFFVRHRRRDLVASYLVVNVGVLAVAAILGTSGVGLGLGLGLFGVLSIIRLRSKELGQVEIAYYFAALAMGLVAGLGGLEAAADLWINVALIAMVAVVAAIVDSRALLARYRHEVLRISGVWAEGPALEAELERLLGATVHRATVQRRDLERATTVVDVRYRVPAEGATAPLAPPRPRAVAEAEGPRLERVPVRAEQGGAR